MVLRLDQGKPLPTTSIKDYWASHVIDGRAIIEGTREDPKVWAVYEPNTQLYWIAHDPHPASYPVNEDMTLDEIILTSRELTHARQKGATL